MTEIFNSGFGYMVVPCNHLYPGHMGWGGVGGGGGGLHEGGGVLLGRRCMSEPTCPHPAQLYINA